MTETEDKPPLAKPLNPVASQALAEADARRMLSKVEDRPRELGGRGGEDPARYGDWEVRGIACDF